MIKSSIKRPVTTCMMVFLVLMLGFVAYMNLQQAYVPDVDLPVALVMTTYEDAGPEEIQELVTKPLEERLATITGVDTITSRSSTGTSIVVIQFINGTDLDTAVNDMRDKLEMVRLPDDANDPSIIKMDMDSESFNVGVTSEAMNVSTLYDYVDENITNYFERIAGVASVEIYGGIDTEVQVILDPEKCSQYGLSISSVASAINAENQNISAGEVKQGSTEMTLRVAGQFDTVEDVKNIYITTAGGNGLLLKDVAKSIKEADLDQDRVAVINGSEGIILSISLSSDGNIVEVSESVVETMNKLEESEKNLDFTMLSTTADYIKRSLNNVVETAFQAALIAVLILLFFLQNWKSALVIGVSIPTSIMATFGCMYLFGMTMNLVSMSGIVIGIGMLVDNSVVVLENIYNFRAKGYSAADAAYEGTREVSMAVFASTLTTVAVFGPFIFISDMIGQLLSDIAITVCVALGASYLVSVTFVPTACALLMASDDRPRKQPKKYTILNKIGDVINSWLGRLDAWYSRVIRVCLRHRFITVAATVVIFILTLSTGAGLGMNLMGDSDEGQISVSAAIPEGYDFDYAYSILDEVMAAIGEIPEAEDTMSMVSAGGMFGSGGSVSMSINLCSSDDRDRSTEEIANEIKEKVKNIAGTDITVSEGSMAMGSFGGSGFTLQINGDDTDTLRQICDDLIEDFETIPGAYNMESSMDDAQYQIDIVVDRAKAASYGLNGQIIANAVYSANNGTANTTLKHDGTETDIRVMYPEDHIEYVKDLYSTTITTGTGAEIPITEVAEIVQTETPTMITRENQVRYVEITGEITGTSSSEQKALIQEKLDDYVFPEGYTYQFGGLDEMMDDTFGALLTVLIVAVILVFLVMASQFESLIQPAIVMFSMPLALTGGLLGLFITRMDITSFALIGFIMLIGMVVNNAIVLVDYTNQRRLEHGMGCNDALVESARSRLRPILMTTLTTVLGMVPMALALSEGMEMQQAMGVVIIFGLSVGTLVTLIFIPVLYSLVNSLTNKIRRAKSRFSPYADADEDKYSRALKAYREKQHYGEAN